jgi:Tol biopolymer transport system component/DNA-binding winged helix-turn-helix (wHTH) protein
MTHSPSDTPGPRVYEFGPFRLDRRERQLSRDGAEVPLTGRAFEILLLLVQSGGLTITKETFMDQVWRDTVVEESNLADNISTIRQLLGDDAREPRYIKTVPRRGYRFVANVRDGDEAPAVRVHERRTMHVVIEEEQPNPMPMKRRLLIAATTTAVIAIIAILAFDLGKFQTQVRQAPVVAAPLRPKVRPLTTSPDQEFSPALSPDGRFAAFCWKVRPRETINIYVMQVDAGTPQQLTSAIGRDASPAWSPDGRFIAFVHHDLTPAASGIYLIPAFGGPARFLYAATAIAGITWSPDGNTIAFSRKNSADEPFTISSLDVNTQKTQPLTHPSSDSYGDYWLTFSPDGAQLAFARLSESQAGDLYVMPAAGGMPRRITFDDRDIVGVAWDPRQDVLIFSSNRDDRQILWKVAAGGGTAVPLEPAVEDAVDPTISRDGRRLIYTRRMIDTNIFRLDIQSPSASPATLIASSRHDQYPRVSPDGQSIAFESDRTGDDEVWVAGADGSSPRQVTSAGRFTATQPAWSPDGREIAYVSRPSSISEIDVISVTGGRARRLSAGEFNCAAPAWSRDGRFVYFSTNRGGEWQVWRIPSSGGAAVQMTRAGGYESAESPDGRSLFYNKYGYGRVGIYRQPATGGEEEIVCPLQQLESRGDWQVTANGLYFIHRYDSPGTEPSKQPSLRFVDFASRQVHEIVPLADPGSNPGLSVVDGEKAIIYSRAANINLDLVLVTNYR